jgi:hypothetical protein
LAGLVDIREIYSLLAETSPNYTGNMVGQSLMSLYISSITPGTIGTSVTMDELFLKDSFYVPEMHIMYLTCINYLCTYDLYSPVHNVLYACISITWASERGLGPEILKIFGPQMALAYRLDAISQGPNNSRIPGPNPLSLALVMDMHAYKTLCTGLYKS